MAKKKKGAGFSVVLIVVVISALIYGLEMRLMEKSREETAQQVRDFYNEGYEIITVTIIDKEDTSYDTDVDGYDEEGYYYNNRVHVEQAEYTAEYVQNGEKCTDTFSGKPGDYEIGDEVPAYVHETMGGIARVGLLDGDG